MCPCPTRRPTQSTPSRTIPKRPTTPSSAPPASPTTTQSQPVVVTTKSTTKGAPTTTSKATTSKLPTTALPVPTETKATSRHPTTKEPTTTIKPTTTISTTKKPTTTISTTRKPTTTTSTQTTTKKSTTTVSTTTKDSEAPIITCPDDITKIADEADDSTRVTWITPRVQDQFTAARSIRVTSTHDSGDRFAIGETSVRYTAVDEAGNEANCEFTVTVTDEEPPHIWCPSDITVLGDPQAATTQVNWATPFATDNSRWISPRESNYQPGSHFPADETTRVEYRVYDRAGNEGTCSFLVTVIGNFGPDFINCPGDMTVTLDQDASNAVVTWIEPTAQDDDGVKSLDSNHAPGSVFGIGTTTVTYRAIDNNDHETTCSFDVHVIDNQAPSIQCPDPILTTTDPSSATAFISLPDASNLSDNSGQQVAWDSDATLENFPIGATPITYTAMDSSGNVAQCSFTVTVQDTENPIIVCPDDIELSTDPSVATAAVTLPDPLTLTDNSEYVSLEGNNPRQRSLPIGQTIVMYTATDSSGNVADCSFSITVSDQEIPNLQCPSSFDISTDVSIGTATVTVPDPVTLSDNSGLDVSLTGNVPRQRILPIGPTTITYVATDFYGNEDQCSFTITVTDNELPSLTCPDDMLIMVPEGSTSASIQRPDPGHLSDNSGNVVLVHNWPTNNQFGGGTTLVTFTARDGSGNERSCSFNVQVQGIPVFAINCPSHITTNTAVGQSTASVAWSHPTIVNHPGGTVTFDDDAPGVFPIGVTMVTVTAMATDGSQATCTFTVTVNDNEDPTLVCPNNIEANTSPGLATVTLQQPDPIQLTDNSGSGGISWESNWPLDNVFPIGVTFIAMTAVDPSGNQALCTFFVTVEDQEDPQVICPAEVMTFALNPDIGGAIPYWSLDMFPRSDNSMMEVTLRFNPESGSLLEGMGDHVITVTAVDTSLNDASCTFTVTIEAPEVSTAVQLTLDLPFIDAYNDLDSPESQELIEDFVIQMDMTMLNSPLADDYGGSHVNEIRSGSVVVIGEIFWRDNVMRPDVIEIVQNAIDMNQGRFGEHGVVGNPNVAPPRDRQSPTLQCPNDIATTSDNSLIPFPAPVILEDNSDGPIAYGCDWDFDNDQFPVGTTTVVCIADDDAGNEADCNFEVSVTDVEDPVIECPEDIVIAQVDVPNLQQPEPLVISDNSGSVSWDSDWPVDNAFPIGETIVTYTATDDAGLMSTCTFAVIVFGPDMTTCADETQVVGVSAFCDGDFIDCDDGSDETPECYCGSSTIDLQQSSADEFMFPFGILNFLDNPPPFPTPFPFCTWEIVAPDGMQVLAQFVDVFLPFPPPIMGYPGNTTAIRPTDTSLVVLSPGNILLVSMDILVYSFTMELTATADGVGPGMTTCDEQFQVVEDSAFCDGPVDCYDASDETPPCYCGESTLDIQSSVVEVLFPLGVQSYLEFPAPFPFPSPLCTWEIIAPDGMRVLAQSVEELFLVFVGVVRFGYPGFPSVVQYADPSDLIISPDNILLVSMDFFPGGTFTLELSATDETDFPLCDNGIEVMPDGSMCNGTRECTDGSDEGQECYCGEMEIGLNEDSSVDLSYPIPGLLPGGFCSWEIHAPDGFGIYGIIMHQQDADLIIVTDDNIISNDFVVPPDEELPINVASLSGFMFIYMEQTRLFPEFLMELSATSETDFIFCNDGVQVVSDESYLCDGVSQCLVGGDEPLECYCGEMEIGLNVDSSFDFSYPTSDLLPLAGLICGWEIHAPEGLGIYGVIMHRQDADFNIILTENNLFIRHDEELPIIDVASPNGNMEIHMGIIGEFPEFLIELSATSETDFIFCNDGVQVVSDESYLCDGVKHCLLGGDEPLECYCGESEIVLSSNEDSISYLTFPVPDLLPLADSCFWVILAPDGLGIYGIIIHQQNATLVIGTDIGGFILSPNEELPIDVAASVFMEIFIGVLGALPEFSMELSATSETDFIFCDDNVQVVPDESNLCDGFQHCLVGGDEPSDCSCGSTPDINLREGTEYILSLDNYPSPYTNQAHCEWTITASAPGCSVYAEFLDFHLAREDYLYVSNYVDETRYTKDRTPPNIVSQDVLSLVFTSDEEETDVGFQVRLTSICDDIAFETCANGIEEIPTDALCNDTVECFDLSDEIECPPCELIPVIECLEILPYDETIFNSDSPANSAEAVQLFYSYLADIENCSANAITFLCAFLFPPCPYEGETIKLCQGFCQEVVSTCPDVPLIDCEALPQGDVGEDFCGLADGDIFDTGICGTRPAFPSTRVVGGDDAPPGSWPWICTIQAFGEHQCGCTLLEEYWVATAAHCVDGGASPSIFSVRVGVSKQSEVLSYEQEKDVVRIIIHPDYSPFTDQNDIAMLQLDSAVEFSDYVRPACLATDLNEVGAYENCMAAGWGRTLEGDYYYMGTDYLLTVDLPLISSARCGGLEFNYGSRITDDMICAGVEGLDTCQGDSGGPLVCQDVNNGLWHLVGITSWGYGCGVDRQPGVYARVAWFISFIEETVTGTTSATSGLCRPDQFQCQDGSCAPSCWDRCDYRLDCADGSDEEGCDYCGAEPDIVICDLDDPPIFELTSANYPSNYPTSFDFDITCQWIVTSAQGSRVRVHFVDFDLDYNSYLCFGCDVSKPYEVCHTGSTLPLDLVSPYGTNTLVITFVVGVFAQPRKGFHLELSCADDDEDLLTCLNGYEVIDESMWCDNNTDCSDYSDEIYCDCGPIDIRLESGAAGLLSLTDYPDGVYCPWTIHAAPGERIHLEFIIFDLQREDYLFIGLDNLMTPVLNQTTRAVYNVLRYTGEQLPPDIISPGQTIYVTMVTDSSNSGMGFTLQMMSTDEQFPTICSNGLEIVTEGECDGVVQCYDCSDELLCPPCETIPVDTCLDLLPYNTTFYGTDSAAASLTDAVDMWNQYESEVGGCHPKALLVLCVHLFPPCPVEEMPPMLCGDVCQDVADVCGEDLYPWPSCENLPVVDDDDDCFCSFKDGDVFGTGICGSRPAFDASRDGRVFGGTDADIGDLPSICSLQIFGNHNCGGTLINEEWVVTAAHCVIGVPISSMTVEFGILNQYTYEPSNTRMSRSVAEIVMHPNYIDAIIGDDIALLLLSGPIEFTDYVRPSCLSTHFNEEDYGDCWIAGWGRAHFDDYPALLQEALTTLIPTSTCQTDTSLNTFAPILDSMICAGGIGDIDSCHGDSGGPLMCQNQDGAWHLVGVVSFGEANCIEPNWPTVYTRVSSHNDFIRNTVEQRTADGLCKPDQFKCDDGQCLPSLWDQCDFATECRDGSDETNCSYCGTEPDITLSDDGTVFHLTSANYPEPYFTSFETDIVCYWVITSATGSSIFIHFEDFDLDLYYAFLYFGRYHAYVDANQRQAGPPEVALTGSVVPLDMISPNGSYAIVITFEVQRYAHPLRGFFVQLSDASEDDSDYIFCDNEWEILPDSELICDGIAQCSDRSDEPMECFCPEPEIIVPSDSKVDLTSYGFPSDYYMNNMRCYWTVQCQQGGRVVADFIFFDLESGYDNLYIGTAQNGRLLKYTGSSLPQLAVVSPADGSPLYFSFETDGSVTDRGFHICLWNVEEEFEVCPGNQLEIADERYFCDGIRHCQDGSDEGLLANCTLQPCGDFEFQCYDGSCIPEFLQCNGYYDCPDGEDEFDCEGGNCRGNNHDEVITISDNETYTLDYYNYHDNAYCQWNITTDGTQRQETFLFIEFATFQLEQGYDYLHFGSTDDIDAYGRFTGSTKPDDFLIADSNAVVTFTSDISITDLGFAIGISTIDSGDLITCPDGSGAFFEDPTCDGNLDCQDSSDERFCPPCTDVPPECSSILSYSQTYFPNKISSSVEQAQASFSDIDPLLGDCHHDAGWFLCSVLFPECQGDAATASPCQGECIDIIDRCPVQFTGLVDECDIFPVNQGMGEPCFLPEGDIHGEGICGSRPAIDNSRVVGGQNVTTMGLWPWIGSIRHDLFGHNCGANLISDSWVLTAAHCVDGSPIGWYVVFGDTLLDQVSVDEQRRNVDAIIVHNDFSYAGLHDDIALLHLCEPVIFTDFVRPICLTRTWEEIEDYDDCWIAGWGSLADFGDVSNILQEVEAPLLSQEDCQNYHIDNGYPEIAPPDSEICAGNLGVGPSACRGDSGGPLACRDPDDNHWHLVGITSKIVFCGEWPGLFTRVSRYYSYIDTVIRRYEECQPPDVSCWNEECNSTICVLEEQLCDGIPHCSNYEDESNCSTSIYGTCPWFTFTCQDGECIPEEYVCDGENDCLYGDDEQYCGTYYPGTCDEYICASGECIYYHWLCDGYHDCLSGEDERNCNSTAYPGTCPGSLIPCPSDGHCISYGDICNGVFDCQFGEDEQGCGTAYPFTPYPGTCPDFLISCPSDGECIYFDQICDGDFDCQFGEDEQGCGTAYPFTPYPGTCPGVLISCPSDGECISHDQICDGNNDCGEGEDETFCDYTPTPEPYMYYTPTPEPYMYEP